MARPYSLCKRFSIQLGSICCLLLLLAIGSLAAYDGLGGAPRVYASALEPVIALGNPHAENAAPAPMSLVDHGGAMRTVLQQVQPPFATCDARSFLIQTPTNSDLYAIDLATGVATPLATNMTYETNAAGFNQIDNYIYGMCSTGCPGNNYVVRIGADFSNVALGPVTGLPAGAGYHIGDISPAGLLYVTGVTDTNFRVIDLNNNPPTLVSTINFSGAGTMIDTGLNGRVADWAFSPIDGQIYTVRKTGGSAPYRGRLLRIDPATGVVTDLGFIQNDVGGGARNTGESTAFGAVYFDDDGFLYISSNTTGKIFRVDTRNPALPANQYVSSLFSTGPTSTQNDGARCAAAPMPVDFGDAPDTGAGPATGSYSTTLASDGPRHVIVAGLSLGANVDSEVDATPNANADGDDTTGVNDDDGVTLPAVVAPGQIITVPVDVTGNGFLNAWIDWDQNGIFDPGEQVAADLSVSNGANTLPVNIPANATLGATYARFRLNSTGGLGPTGVADDGEVEDYALLVAQPALEASKDDTLQVDANGDGVVSPGDTLRYTVVITNIGAGPAFGVEFLDTIAADLNLVVGSVTTSQGAVTIGNTTGDVAIGVAVGVVPAGGTVTIRFDLLISNSVPTGITEVANQGDVATQNPNVANEPTDDPATGTDDDPTVTPLVAAPDIETYKRDTLLIDADGDGVPSPGDTLTYSVTVRNTGNMAASAVAFNDTPGANTRLVVGSVTATQGVVVLGNSAGDSSVQVSIGTLNGANAEVTIQFNVTIDNPLPAGVTQVANQGITTATSLPAVPSDDPDTAAGSDPTITPVSAAPALDATKRDALLIDGDGNGSPSPGDTLVYTVTIINVGNAAATGIDFTDTPDPNTALVVGSVATSQGAISTGNNGGDATIAVAIGALAGNGGQATIVFHVTIDNPVAAGVTQVSNQGLVASNELPTLPTDDPATPALDDPTITPITATPVLNSTKSDLLSIDADGNGVVSPGDTLLYNVTVINSGNSNTTGVIFSDIPDVNTSLVVGSVATDLGTITTGNSAGDATVAVAIGAIPGAGGQVNISFEVTIDNPLPAGVTQVSNQGITSSNELPVNPTDDPATPTMDDPTDTPVVAAPLIDSFKSDTLLIDADGNGAVSPGDTLLYNVTIINGGNTAATGVLFADSPDANTMLVVGSVAASAGVVTTGNGAGDVSVGVDIGTLPGGNAQVDISFEVTINDPLPAGVTQVSNQGLTSSNELPDNQTDDPDDPTMDDPTDTPIVAAPRLEAAKRDQLFVDADGNNLPSPGDTLVYLITIINDGNQAATNLIFTDAPDPFTTLVGGSVQTDLGAVTTGNNVGDNMLAIDIGTLPGGGAQVDISFNVTIDNPLPAGVTQVSNQGIVSSSELPDQPTDDPDTPAADDPTDTPIVAAPIIEGFKQDSLLVDADNDGAPSPGDTLLYNITIMNTGNSAATGVLFDDSRPANTQLEIGSVNTSLGAITSGNNSGDSRVTVDIGTLPGGSQVDISFNVMIANPLPTGVSQISNQGGITSNELPPEPTDDPDTGPDDDPTLTPVTTNPALDALKRASHLVDADANGAPSPGDTVLYNITIQNTGNVPLTNLVYNDTPDANTTLVVGTIATSLGTVTNGNNSGDSTISISVGTLPSGSQVNISYHTTINAPFPTDVTEIVNQGSVTSNELPSTPTDDPGTAVTDDPTTLPVNLPPVLEASKTSKVLVDGDNNGLLGGGDTLRYTVVIVNPDPLPATGVFFTDTPDPNTTLIIGSVQTSVGAVTTGNGAGDTTVRVDIGALPAGASVTIVLDVLLNNPLPADITQVINQGLANSNGQPPVPTDDIRTPDLDDGTAETIPRPTTLGDSPEPDIQGTLTVRVLLPLINR